ncbi:MAG: alanine racemase [Ruminococcus sp.]|nr:alanine racemase [Ruminococcus sp.]MCM1480475.1 alanine racemase [Muribaculaceae bacterium]
MEKHFLKRVRAEINLGAAEHNFKAVKALLDPVKTKPACVIKADGYGHGDRELLRLYEELGADFFCVSNITEALRLRANGCKGDVLILSWSDPEDMDIIAENNIISAIVSVENAQEISRKASRPVRAHIKLDTGMNRVGISAMDTERCAAEIAEIAKLPNIAVEGVFTHFAVADERSEESLRFTERQKELFFAAADRAEQLGVRLAHKHCLNSAGAIFHYDGRSTLARFGIVLYGLKPDYSLKMPISLQPVMELKSVISHIKVIGRGETVSYGRTYTADGDRVIATVPCGYADGYPRLLSGRNEVLVRGRRARGVGRVCMDQMMIDVTDVPGAAVGDEVVLFGKSGAEVITADDLAEKCGMIGYEIICGISGRVPRVYVRDGETVGYY